MSKFTNILERFVIPIVVTCTLAIEGIIPESWILPLSIAVTVVAVIVCVINGMWIMALAGSKTKKGIDLFAKLLKDKEAESRALDVTTLVWVSLAGMFAGIYVVSILFMVALITAMIRYWGYISSEYDDDFRDPDGFV